MLNDRKSKTFVECMRNIKRLYAQRGFDVSELHTDEEFECDTTPDKATRSGKSGKSGKKSLGQGDDDDYSDDFD